VEPRISFVTLAVADLDAARRFYVDGLGWRPEHSDDEVCMILAGPRLMLSLWRRDAFEAEVGAAVARDGVPAMALAHNVATPADVDAVLETARAAGASQVSTGTTRAWGGYTGYFADPDGFRWEVAHNPGPTGEMVLP